MREELARQQLAELRQRTPGSQAGPRVRDVRASSGQREPLRVRTGWTLVGLGLKLATQAHQGPAARPRPVRP